MDKNSRLTLIRERYYQISGCPLPGLLHISRYEVKETVTIEVSRISVEMNDEICDEEIKGFAPTLPEEKVSSSLKSEDEETYLLSEKEKKQLEKDISFFRSTHPQISLFPLFVVS